MGTGRRSAGAISRPRQATVHQRADPELGFGMVLTRRYIEARPVVVRATVHWYARVGPGHGKAAACRYAGAGPVSGRTAARGYAETELPSGRATAHRYAEAGQVVGRATVHWSAKAGPVAGRAAVRRSGRRYAGRERASCRNPGGIGRRTSARPTGSESAEAVRDGPDSDRPGEGRTGRRRVGVGTVRPCAGLGRRASMGWGCAETERC